MSDDYPWGANSLKLTNSWIRPTVRQKINTIRACTVVPLQFSPKEISHPTLSSTQLNSILNYQD